MTKPTKQRLAIFLDGTWNTEDDSTHVLNAYHNTTEGMVMDEDGNPTNVIQKRYYDRGVGTSVSDNIRGGGFGVGLDENVREAYNWLIDNYNGGGEDDPNADEIHIFGFSRGAYTARSLVGLIAACGLVKRGAPLTVTQLWNGYTFVSKNRHRTKNSWWKENLSKAENKHYFRRITRLKKIKQEDKLLNKSEKLVKNWSVRVNINYLGIYDTVGALGVLALGIPGLRSKKDRSHNQNPNRLLQKCRHALAIDEHRTSFRLTPMLDYVNNEIDEGAELSKATNFYKDRIHQMWFAGVHSNIGGGYANNVLSIAPYDWIMEGATNAGLNILKRHNKDESIDAETPAKSDIRDSYAELAGAVYPHFVRSKRYFRPIGRDDLVRSGYTLRSINENIHHTVFEIAKADDKYAPPNLMAYLSMHPKADKKKVFEGRSSQHNWPGEMMNYGDTKSPFKDYLLPRILLVIWSVIAALGLIKLSQFFWIESISPKQYVLPLIAAIFILADWGETKVTLATSFYPRAIKLGVIWNILYWIRLLGILAFLSGLIFIIYSGIKWNFQFNFSASGLWDYVKIIFLEIFQLKNIVALIIAAAMMFILDIVGNKTSIKIDNESLTINPKKLSLVGEEAKGNYIFIGITYLISAIIVAYFIYSYWNTIPIVPHSGYLSGSLILIFLLILALPSIFEWVGKPMSKYNANIGSIVQLQTAFGSEKIKSLFNAWTKKIHRNWSSPEDEKIIRNVGLNTEELEEDEENMVVAWIRVREILRKSVWRDIIGFVPLYSFIFGTILCIGSTVYCQYTTDIECYRLPGNIPLWLGLIIFTAIFDQLENMTHLMHIKYHPKGGSPTLLVGMGAFFTFLKFIGFFTSILLSIAVLIFIGYNVHEGFGGWKWMIATIMTYVFLKQLWKIIQKAMKKD